MPEMRVCDNCAMEFDWEGVSERGYDYCCAACARGEECTCPQHDHRSVSEQPLPSAAANQIGITGET